MLTRFSSTKLNEIMHARGISAYKIQEKIIIMRHEGHPVSRLTAANIYQCQKGEQQPRIDKLASLAAALEVGVEELME
jgi:transcriptional regulator with XRE-family HTH domain